MDLITSLAVSIGLLGGVATVALGATAIVLEIKEEGIVKPTLPLDFLHHLADSLVDCAEGAVAKRPVLHHEHWHRGTCDAGHRPDSTEMMIGLEFDFSIFQER